MRSRAPGPMIVGVASSLSHPLMDRNTHNPHQRRGGQRPPQASTSSANDDFVMNEAERGVGSTRNIGTSSSFPSSSSSSLHVTTTQQPPPPPPGPAQTDWGMGIPEWGPSEDEWAIQPDRNDPALSRSAATSSSSQPYRTTSAPARTQAEAQFNGLATYSRVRWET
jgi:hypothetical protein